VSAPDRAPTASERVRGYAVHAYTATGVAFAFAAAAELCAPRPSPVRFFLLNVGAVLVDATDGPLARAWHVKKWAPSIDGRTIDDIVDYLTFTFLPLLLVWRMGWLPEPRMPWIVPALMASLFGFANTGAKDEGAGFFLGFPSYWNVVAFYAGIAHHFLGPWINAVLLLALAVLTVLPVRFIYPNLAPRPWKVPLLAGGLVWLGILIGMLTEYPAPPGWLVSLSLVYPALYTALSVHLSRRP
jgi:phosphatidylcholine synthase